MASRVAWVALWAVGCGPGWVDCPDCDPLVGRRCDSDADCPEARCVDGEPPTCRLACRDEDDCGAAEACRPAVLRARDHETPGLACQARLAAPGELGDACDDGATCATGVCVDGRCSEACLGGCGVGALCEPATVDTAAGDLSLGACRLSLAAGVVVAAALPLGQEPPTSVVVQVGDATASLTLVAQNTPGPVGERVGFVSIAAPDGTTLFDRNAAALPLNPVGIPYPGAAAALVPDADSAALPAGPYTVRTGLFTTEDLLTYTEVAGSLDTLSAVLEPATEEGGALDLALGFAPNVAVDPADPWSSPYLQAFVEEVGTFYWSAAGIPLGEVEVAALPASVAFADDGDDIRALCAGYSAPGPHRTSINVFVIETLTFTGGFSGGIPGPPGVFGTEASCIVLGDQGDGRNTGIVATHELGHFLGLFHTTTFGSDGAGVYSILGADALTDTPTCASGSTSFAECADYDNLMFPFFPLQQLRLTPSQTRIVRRSPLLYEVPRPDRCPEAGTVHEITAAGRYSSDTGAGRDALAGTCGGSGAPEQPLLLRVAAAATATITVTPAADWAPAVYAFAGGCDGEELACATASAGQPVQLEAQVPGGDLIIVVDGAASSGRFELELELQAPVR